MEMIEFAWRYARINTDKTEDVDYNNVYYYGISIDTINEITQKFFGKSVGEEDVPVGSVDKSGDYLPIVIDGKVCYVAADGDTYNHMSIAKNVYGLDNGNRKVEFIIYSIEDEDIVPPTFGIEDKTLYYFTDEKAKQHPAFYYHLSGTAVIEPYISSSGKQSYRLISYELRNGDEVLSENPADLQAVWENYIESTGETSAYFLLSDFDGNGVQEAFGITGIFDGEMIYSDVKIYYINSAGNITYVRKETENRTSLYGYLLPQIVDAEDTADTFLLSASDSKFIVWEVNAYGSGSSSIILGVRDGVAYEPDISNQYSSFTKSDTGEFVAFTLDHSSGGLDFIKNTFVFDEAAGEFYLVSPEG